MIPFYFIFYKEYQEKHKNKYIQIFLNNELKYEGRFKNLDLEKYNDCLIARSERINKNFLSVDLVK